jgi:AcrR family transcriptional regulator
MRPLKSKSKTEILEIAIPLFAKTGYDGVSMRDIAKAVGVSAAALYHHFPNKQALYLAAMSQAFADKSSGLVASLDMTGTLQERLGLFVTRLCELMCQDQDFNILIQREILDGDDSRLQVLAKEIYHDLFQGVTELCRELGPAYDPHLLAISIIGLVAYHFQTGPIRQYLPGGKQGHNEPAVIAQHVTLLLLSALKKR